MTPLVPRDGHIDLFVTDAAGVVWSTWWESAPGWQSWFAPFPGVPLAAGTPVTALARIGHIDLFATAGNGAVFTAWWEFAPGWMKWFMPGSVQNSDLEARIKSWRSSNQIPPFAPDQLLMVFTKTLRLSNQGVEFCGFHSKLGAGEYYSITPLLTPDARCSNNDTASFQSVISHELQEAMTDPDVATGWSDALSEEGGDPGACNFNRQALPFGAVQRFADNQGQTCSTWINSLLAKPASSVTALLPRSGHIDLFATDAAGAVWSAWWEADLDWQTWFQISPGTPVQGGATVTALTPRDGHIDLFATDAAGNVWSTWWESSRAGRSGSRSVQERRCSRARR